MTRPSDDELAAGALPLARWIANDFARRSGYPYQELKSECYLAIAECLPRWDPEAGTTFNTFASYRMRGACQDYMRARDEVPRHLRRQGITEPRYHVISLELYRQAGHELCSPPDPGSDGESLSYKDFHAWLERESPRWLDDRMRWVMHMYFVEDRSMVDIAEAIGVTGARVTHLLNKVWEAAAAYGATLAEAERAS